MAYNYKLEYSNLIEIIIEKKVNGCRISWVFLNVTNHTCLLKDCKQIYFPTYIIGFIFK